MVETGYLDSPYDVLFGVMAPSGTPAAVIDKLNGAINDALRSPELLGSLAKLGIEPKITTPAEFMAIIKQEIPKWAEVVRVTGVKVE
jgi:tripartite-type tricarboxylate transporter receptor subunit TctC